MNASDKVYPGREYESRAWWPGMDMRTYLAAKAMQAMIAASYGDEGYVPGKKAADFVEDANGSWYEHNGFFYSGQPKDQRRYRLATTHEQRLARDAAEQADALIEEMSKGKP